ncbi:e3 ubiquitin-protein ligase [Gigaspora margarita]|uniref:E3 ubiquitin-protein ligase n=1 Tax=Gigaspora margarita TaxID=4874 RepID=A0A8H4ALT5_GIGMA|nr:e3 ubiquitin-protein ligase [Gigaspora margarita]
MGQIDKFRSLYEEELAMLKEKEENLDANGDLKAIIIDDHIEIFFANIISSDPTLKLPQLIESAELYFKDFLSTYSPTSEDIEFLSWIIGHNIGQQIPNPFKLHVYWWSNSEIVQTELQLSKLCPKVIEAMLKLEFDQSKKLNFENHLLEQLSIMMIEKLCKIAINDINHIEHQLLIWQRETTYILSLSSKLPNLSDNPNILKLRIYNDLSYSLELQKLIEIRNLEKNNKEIISEQFIYIVFEKIYELQQTEDNLALQRSFVNWCLNTLSLESSIRLILYEKIFTQEPLPSLSFPTIHQIFLTEFNKHNKIFFNLINNPLEILEKSERLLVIEDILSKKHPDSQISALCCDVIQTKFFLLQDFQELSKYFQKSTKVLVTVNAKKLQRISAIALLKVFINNLWNFTSIQKSLKDPIKFEFGNEEEFSINDLNQCLELQNPLIHSLKYYLLKSLRLKGFSIHDINQFCEVQQQIMPWLSELVWNYNRSDYNPYWYVKQYERAEIATNMLSYGDSRDLDALLEDILDPTTENLISLRISFAGIIIMRLYIIRATREWNQSETLLAQKIKTYFNRPQFPQFYKQPMLEFLSNEHALCKIVPNDVNQKIFISSVIAHIVALHISIPQNSSPLATYMQALQSCQDDFILACPSNVMMNVWGPDDRKITRFQCKCGQIYFIGESGDSKLTGRCSACKEEIGGDQRGYIVEEKTTENLYSIRSMSPASYRIIHLFVHAIIGIQTPSEVTSKFFKHNIKDLAAFCAMHINNDWDALKFILYCGDEQLALVLHAILSEMTQQPLQEPARLNTPIERETWEIQFSQKYISPLIEHATGTATKFSNLLETNMKNTQQKTKTEISETMKLDDHYCENYLPRLWRLVRNANINNLRAYFSSNYKEYPFLTIFLQHEDKLQLIKNLFPIVKFVQILSTSLSYRIERQEARTMTFRQFILNESDSDETHRTLNKAFANFTNSWNKLTPYIKRYQCHNLPPMPKMHDNLPVVFGLLEPINESLLLCAVIDFLVQLQNKFLNEVIEIPSKTCQSLKFLEKIDIQNNDEGYNQSIYHLKSVSLDNARPKNIIFYDGNSENFQFSQFDMRVGHCYEIQYDLRKTEAELALKLVYEKSLIKPNEEGLYLEPFVYRKEMFSRSMTIFNEIKNLIPQERIPKYKEAIFIKAREGMSAIALENPKELLSTLETILCFLKRTFGSDRDILITEYIESWMKLTALKKYGNSYKLLLRIGLQLKHIVALYELIEEHVDDVVATCIPQKYQEKLDDSLQHDILDAVDLESLEQGEQAKSSKILNIPAKAFATALKRFIIRYSTTCENINETESLICYLVENESLECWPDWVDKTIIKNKFPSSLRISHTFETYQFIKEAIEKSEMEK